jgi:FkbM family methyltransferase
MNKNLIFDIGAYRGEDAEFYLAKGFDVVSVEANPVFASAALKKNEGAHSRGHYRMEVAAIAAEPGEVEFHVHDHEDWSSTRKDARFVAGSYRTIRVPAITAAELFARYGIPYYVKIDIEGLDWLVLNAVCALPDKPNYVSFELDPHMATFIPQLAGAGYTRFKLVTQSDLPSVKLPRSAREGKDIKYRFTTLHSGPFGEETAGSWLGLAEIEEQITNIDRSARFAVWHDVHAALPDREQRATERHDFLHRMKLLLGFE